MLLAASSRRSVSGRSAYLEGCFCRLHCPSSDGAGCMALGHLKGLGEIAEKQVATN